MQKSTLKKLLAWVLACVLIVCAIPAFATELSPVVVDPTIEADQSGNTTDSETGYLVYKTISAAIDSFGGEKGKVYLKGTLSATGAEIEGTRDTRAEITIAGYGDVATGGTLTATGISQTWLKGDITFENITLSSGNNGYGFNSNGHTITFGSGIVSADEKLNVGGQYSHKGNNVVFNSGTFNIVAARSGWSNSNPTTGATHYVFNSGVTATNIYAGIAGSSDNSKTFNINSKMVMDFNGGTFNYLYIGSWGYKQATANKADTIININKLDKAPSNGVVFAHSMNTVFDGSRTDVENTYPATKFGNVALVVDCAGMPGKLGVYNRYWTGYALIPDEGKYFIAIANNYDSSKFGITEYEEEAYNVNSLDYIIYTVDGVTQPVFENTTAGDDTTSTLKGFTITSNNGSNYVPTINGVKLSPIGYTSDGTPYYDLSAYKGTRTEKTVKLSDNVTEFATHITDTTPVTITFTDNRGPIVTTLSEEDFPTPDGCKRFDNLTSAIEYLGASGGTVYIKGEVYTETIEESSTVTSRSPITISGYGTEENSLYINNANGKIYGDITFENISLSAYSVEQGYSNGGFYSWGKTITFGNGVKTGTFKDSSGNIHTDYTLNLGVSKTWNGGNQNIVVNSGTFQSAHAVYFYYPNYAVNYNITLNGGTITNVTAGYNLANYGRYEMNADYKFTMTGGSNNQMTPFAWTWGELLRFKGDVVFDIQAGQIQSIVLHDTAGYAYTSTADANVTAGNVEVEDGVVTKVNPLKTGNIAVIVNEAGLKASGDTWYRFNAYDNTLKSYIQANTNKKIILVRNYAENGLGNWENAENVAHYRIETYYGETKPVFERTDASDPSTSYLKGFTITTDKGSEYTPTINGVKLTPDANGLYDLSAYADNDPQDGVDGGIIKIEFVKDLGNYVDYRNPLTNTVNKIKNNQNVNVVYFGGSVTAGTGSTNDCWRTLTEKYINSFVTDSGSTSTVNHINKALGETGTFLGAYRTPHDIITANPDLLFIEYAINDAYGGCTYSQSMSQMESIVREVKAACPNCDIVFVITTDQGKLLDARDGKLHANALAHIEVAKHYGISTIRVGQALASMLPDGDLTSDQVKEFWSGYAGDYSHPNDTGYAFYFSVIREFLQSEFAGGNTNTPVNVDVTKDDTIVSSNLFDGNRTLVYGDGATVVEKSGSTPVTYNSTTLSLQTILSTSKGFTYNSESFNVGQNSQYTGSLVLANGTAGELTFTFTGTELAFYSNLNSGSKLTYTVDGSAEKTITTNGHNPEVVFKGLKAGTHTVTVKFNWSDISLWSNNTDLSIKLVMFRDASKQTGEYNYGKYYVKYGGTGDGSSPESPAKSVAWLINNVIADAHTADENVEIYIMQDDDEILYNSTAYTKGGTDYTAPQVGNDSGTHRTPDNHITAWTSSNDGTAKQHAATITIKSYTDGSSDVNYLAFSHKLGANVSINLQGPTVFDNIYLLAMRGTNVSVVAGGNSATFTDNYRYYGVPVDEYGDLKQWDGTFITEKSTSGSDTVIKGVGVYTGRYYSNIENTATSARIELNTSYYKYYRDIVIGNYPTYENSNYKDVTVVFNAPTDIDSYKFGGTNVNIAPTPTSFTTLNLVINYKGTINVRSTSNVESSVNDYITNATVTKGVQLIRNSANSAKWGHIRPYAISQNTLGDIATNNNVPFFDVAFNNTDTPYLDVYTDENGDVVLGKYTVLTDERVVAYNKDTNEFIYSDNGVLDLTKYNNSTDLGGRFWVYKATDVDSNGLLTYGSDTVLATQNNTEITVKDLTVGAYEGKAFIGWKLNGEFIKTATVTLQAGNTLEAVYAEYSTSEDFYINGVQMRLDKEGSIRFVLTLKNSLFTKLTNAGATLITNDVAYGSLILPTELTYGQDLVYGESIYDRNGNFLGTPQIVKGVNTYADVMQGSEKIGVQYTVAVTDVTGNKLIRNYSVQGYVRYIDANGNERVLYSDYGQSSLYRAALRLSEDTTQTAEDRAKGTAVATEVKTTVQQSYLTYLNSSITSVTKKAYTGYKYYDNLTLNTYANGLGISDFNIDWNYNEADADTTATRIVQITDSHLVYSNRMDYAIDDPATMSATKVRFESFKNGDENAVRVMQFAMTANKTIITGDLFDYLAEGCAQKAQRLMLNYNVNYQGKFGTVSAAVGNHEFTRAYGTIPDTGTTEKNNAWVQDHWTENESSYYQMEIVYNDNGKNPVMNIILHNGNNTYDYMTEADVAQFKADVAKARQLNIPVLIYEHISLSVDGGAMKHVTGTSFAGNTLNANGMSIFVANASMGDRRGEIYRFITENADVIRGIFCGHEHDYYYGEISGTGENGTGYTIPQILFAPNYAGKGYALRINVNNTASAQ